MCTLGNLLTLHFPHYHFDIQGEIIKSRTSESSRSQTRRASYQPNDLKVSSTTGNSTSGREEVWTTKQSSSQVLEDDFVLPSRQEEAELIQRKNRLTVPGNTTASQQQRSSSQGSQSSRFNRFSSFRNSFNSMTSSRKDKKKKGLSRTGTRTAPREETIPFQLNSVSQIDKFCRVIFPLTFIVVNYFYWNLYLNDEEDDII